MTYQAHPSAIIDTPCQIGEGTRIWHFAHVCQGAVIGDNCVLSQNVLVAPGVRIGSNVKIQNNVAVYEGVEVEDDVFLGPSCVLTNVTNPRSQVSRRSLYEPTRIRRGTTVGANATILCGITLGRYCMVGAGAVVTRDVPEYALVLGAPARFHAWVSRHGHPMTPDDRGLMQCPESGLRYREEPAGIVKCLDLDEDAPLPEELARGEKSYRQFREPKAGAE